MSKRLTKDQLRDLRVYAQHIGDAQLAACAARALDGDSLYNDSIQERCQAAYAGICNSKEFGVAVRRSRSEP